MKTANKNWIPFFSLLLFYLLLNIDHGVVFVINWSDAMPLCIYLYREGLCRFVFSKYFLPVLFFIRCVPAPQAKLLLIILTYWMKFLFFSNSLHTKRIKLTLNMAGSLAVWLILWIVNCVNIEHEQVMDFSESLK